MPITEREVERRLDRNENDVLELYTMVRDIQRTVKSHDVRFDGIDGRLDKVDGRLDKVAGRLDNIDQRLSTIDTSLSEVLRRLPEN